jgi:hypothetical protein
LSLKPGSNIYNCHPGRKRVLPPGSSHVESARTEKSSPEDI